MKQSEPHYAIKAIISLISFIAAIVIGFIALFIPPQGTIDSSVLWFTAQLLVFTSGILGIDFKIDSLRQTANTSSKKRSEKVEGNQD